MSTVLRVLACTYKPHHRGLPSFASSCVPLFCAREIFWKVKVPLLHLEGTVDALPRVRVYRWTKGGEGIYPRPQPHNLPTPNIAAANQTEEFLSFLQTIVDEAGYLPTAEVPLPRHPTVTPRGQWWEIVSIVFTLAWVCGTLVKCCFPRLK